MIQKTQKQREVFNVFHIWAKNYVKYDVHDVKSVHIFLLGKVGTGKPNLVKVIYSAVFKILPYHCKNPEKLRVHLQEVTGITAVNIGGSTIYSCFEIKSGTTLLGLKEKFKAEEKFLIINELSMVSSDLWEDIDSRLGELFMMISEKVFADLSVMTVAGIF